MKTVSVRSDELGWPVLPPDDSVDVHEATAEEVRAAFGAPAEDGLIFFYADLPDGQKAGASCETSRYDDHARAARFAVASLVFRVRREAATTDEPPLPIGPMTRLDAAESHWLGRALEADATMTVTAVPGGGISVGKLVELDETPGVDPVHGEYDAIQRPLRTAHGSMDDAGRVTWHGITPAPYGGPAVLFDGPAIMIEMGEPDEQDVKDRILRNVKFTATMSGAIVDDDDDDDDAMTLDCECPWCGRHMGGGEFFDGSETRCVSCGKPIVAVAYADFMAFRRIGDGIAKRPADRKATRKRWRRQGRR